MSKNNQNGWTGGQYSLFRILLGSFILYSNFWISGFSFSWIQTILALMIVVGALDRFAAAWLLIYQAFGILVGLPWIFSSCLLFLHICATPLPFGSMGASWDGLVAKQINWKQRNWISSGALTLLVVVLFVAIGQKLFFQDIISKSIEFQYWNALFWPSTWLWTGLTLMLVFDPARIKCEATAQIVFYDGKCGLCHRWTKLLSLEQPDGATKFAPLQSEVVKGYFSEEELGSLPDTMVVIDGEENKLLRSDGPIYLLKQLGGYWKILGIFAGFFPAVARNYVYDLVAGVRHRFFKTPKGMCPILPEQIRHRFIA